MTYAIRDALHADLPAIRDIYNDAVLNTTAIWNEQAVDLGNRQAWFSARQAQGYPILVIVDTAERVLGYASFGDWRPFDGFPPHRRTLGVCAQRPTRQWPRPTTDGKH